MISENIENSISFHCNQYCMHTWHLLFGLVLPPALSQYKDTEISPASARRMRCPQPLC